MKRQDEADWNDEAAAIAREAHEENFSSRRGAGTYNDDPDLLYLYDNNPYPDESIRPAILGQVKEKLAERNIRVLGEASYPDDGADAGYTVAIVFDVSDFDGDAEQAESLLVSIEQSLFQATIQDEIAVSEAGNVIKLTTRRRGEA